MHITWESFCNPKFFNLSVKKNDGRYYNLPRTDFPLGVLSMSSYIKDSVDIGSKLIDFNAEVSSISEVPFGSFDELCRFFFQRLEGYTPDIVGISSLFSPSYENFLTCGREARDLWGESIIVGGGNIPTNSYELIYKSSAGDVFDGLCFGEGERPMRELVMSQDYYDYLDSSTAWITKDKVASGRDFKPEHDFVIDLDEIPFYDYELCDFNKHQANQLASSFGGEESFSFHVMTSRGCPFKCTFCASHQTHGREMRYHSIDRVRKDFSKIVNEYGAESLVFQDDHLMADKQRVYEILSVVKDLEVNSVYQNGLTLYSMDKQMLQAFYDAGVRQLVLPVESGSEKVLKHQMRKPLKMKISYRVAKDCREMGIYTNTNILIGMPGETKHDLEEARKNLKSLETNWFGIACASPIVGSEMHEVSLKNGYISDQTTGSDYRLAVVSTEDFSAEFIQEYQYVMNLDLNFVNNQDLRHSNWEWAILGFDKVLSVKEDHAFAYYCLSYIYRNTGEDKLAVSCYDKYLSLIEDPFWGRWAYIFSLDGFDRSAWDYADFGLLEEVLTEEGAVHAPSYMHGFMH